MKRKNFRTQVKTAVLCFIFAALSQSEGGAGVGGRSLRSPATHVRKNGARIQPVIRIEESMIRLFASEPIRFIFFIMRNDIVRITMIQKLHAIAGFEKPRHPMVSVVDYSKVKVAAPPESARFVFDFFSVNFKSNCSFLYGRQPFDHGEGTVCCTAPGQIITFDRERDTGRSEGWGLFFHPDFLRTSTLGRKIEGHSFFSYAENEALHISEQEKRTLFAILKRIKKEYQTTIDRYSREIILSHIDLLLNYCSRFYGRQFITRTTQNCDLMVRFEVFLKEYFNSPDMKNTGLPTVKFCARAMNLSPNYFSDLLKSETGKSAQEHIHYHLLEKAKTLLLSSGQTVNEIAYGFGFEYPQNFSKLFKNKIGISPTAFRNLTERN